MNNRGVFLRAFLYLAVLNLGESLFGAIKLPSVFGDNMVMQRGQSVPVWGWADTGKKVTVQIADQILSTTADNAGRWKVVFDELPVGKPLAMRL